MALFNCVLRTCKYDYILSISKRTAFVCRLDTSESRE